mgnify:CR=1 FL=1
MRSRTLMRPMFRIGGSAGTGITSGLDRPGYRTGIGPNMLEVAGRSLPGNALTNKTTSNIDRKPTGIGMGTLPGFLTGLGLNIASARPTGNIFSTIAGAAKEPFETFQQAKFAEAKEEREFERERELQLLKNLDEDSRSAIMKQAEEGFEAGLYSSVNEGVKRLLQTKEFGVADRPGEARQKNIDNLVDIALRQPGMDPVKDEPIVRNQITIVQDYGSLTKNNADIDFAPAPLMIIEENRKDYEPGKVYYSGEQDKFYVFNGPDAEKPFTPVDVKR